MKLGRIIAAAATSGLLLSGAFVVAEEYTGHNVFAVNLDNSNKIELKTKKGTVREVLIANDIPFGADDRVEPGLDTKVNGGETISIYKAREITIVDGDTTTVRKTTYKKVGDILKELNIALGEKDEVTPGLNSEVATVDTIKIARTGKTTETKKVITEATAKVVVVGTKQRTAAQQQEVAAAKQSYAAPAQSYSAPGGSVVLSNGNTAGAEGAAAAQEMARRTGVPASTWEHIIARESNGQVGARNASGASGLFQTMPGWGSTATVQDQINAATRAYQAQGLSAWGMR